MTGQTSRLVGYAPCYAAAFAELNYQWIEEYFAVEPEDRLALDNPQAYAIEPGGNIFFVIETDALGRDRAVGTAAIVPSKLDACREETVYELAKMAVRPDRRGLGYGHRLMQACIEYAQAADADEIMLVTNDKLRPALATYQAAGFEKDPNYNDPRYERGNLLMRKRLK